VLGDGMARDSNDDNTEPDTASPTTKPKKDQISKALKQVYNEVAEEPLPDRFTELLAKLKSDGGS